ncbi:MULTISPECIES: peptidoglycan D,D-transpeptidase FtsI family protein [Streptomycetaceae]|uniref:Putative penicillin-binding protein n=1 Tax=Streptantibioticus cattleyicolor (strain ATCC 35852 / DSM 46488 / JCM 4925 / NBRC 14057 / NRRL 8057) TaxID=1003195 RepID=F8JTB6_STREN|nr:MULTISPECIES: penicillin-binding protein 2 [Streptomycetaceae]AEW94266.1 putative penicillin-binding protein [Streptantibioticus cattleyicolor NRRL 8057 = DSM 46488]MYS58921.1 penicillin-binding protein 2 [Streptomyces sp. SID5468]CCB74620.1 putative penicillin-binding protein [Streptantibioticus cattleyicolor NRRL 8057 = DSM 46488]
MNKTIRRTSIFCLLLVIAVMARASWVQAVKGQALADDKHNRRNMIARYANPFGDIIVAGKPITGSARTTGSDFAYKRTYPNGGLYAPVTGYSSQVYGATQLEGVYQNVLNGTDSRTKSLFDVLTGKNGKPGDVLTTIDPAVQKAAFDGLGNRHGAAVALDPKTGDVLGLVSAPSYDPSKIAGSSKADAKAWVQYTTDKQQPMNNRAIRETYPPGSTFKLVVAAAALENNLYSSVDQKTDSPYPYTLPGTLNPLPNENASAPCKDASIRVALEYSCNTVFAKMAIDLGQDKVKAMADKFGFDDSKLEIPISVATSVYPTGMPKSSTGQTGIGQFDVRATPLQMAMVGAAIANNGELMQPRLVTKVVDGGGDALQTISTSVKSHPVSARTAEQLRSAMVSVVQQGTGVNAQIPGMEVGGKTGTAQHGVDNSGNPYAWFVSYAKNSAGKEIAVAVMVDDPDGVRSEISGNGMAGPIAKAMTKAALGTS